MGIISKLKNKFDKANEKPNEKQNQISRKEIKEIELFFPRFRSKAKHNYGKEITQIYTVKVKINSESYGEATILDDGDIPICVEIPENTSLEELLNDQMLGELYENGYFQNMSSDHYNMLGRITIEEGRPRINEMSEKMINSIKTLNLDEELRREQKEFKKRLGLQEQYTRWKQEDDERIAKSIERINNNRGYSENEI